MMVLAPALGSPTEELVQDTLKSILISFFALATALSYFWDMRTGKYKVHLHPLLLLPLTLCLYALGSMAWSHTYLAGVEAVRWFVFGLIFFLGLNSFSLNLVTTVVWGIHLGAVTACLWTALQFWGDFSFFAQGPNPASTFVNRNFFGEFVVCTFPYSVLLMTRVRDKTSVYFLTFALGFNVVALMMTGTRSALTGLLLTLLVLPGLLYLCRRQVVSSGWRVRHWVGLLLVFVVSVSLLSSITTRNPLILKEDSGTNALERATSRVMSLAKPSEYSKGSFSTRTVMWKDTLRMIAAHPLAGVGAGAWEVQVPLFQASDTIIETDYYAHNEYLQLIAEYGLTGWIFLLLMVAYLVRSTWLTWSIRAAESQQELPVRAFTLLSLSMLLLVSNAGFPWRMACTGALFALSLALLAASDARLNLRSHTLGSHAYAWGARKRQLAFALTALCSLFAVYIAQQAIECESKLVRAVKTALTIRQSSSPNDPDWDKTKEAMLTTLREGMAINPHYRKLTPIVADSFAGWGDWKNANWIWESVLASRPYVLAIMTNLTRGYLQEGDLAKAGQMIERIRQQQPGASGLKTLEVTLWSRSGREHDAAQRAKELLRGGAADFELVKTAYNLGMRIRDPELAIMALETRNRTWPGQAIDGWLKLGLIYAAPQARDEAKALENFRAALKAAAPTARPEVLARIPPKFRASLE